LVNPAGGTMAAGEFQLQGEGAALRYQGDRLEKVLVVGKGEVRVKGQKAGRG